jgi:hypothetical protein
VGGIAAFVVGALVVGVVLGSDGEGEPRRSGPAAVEPAPGSTRAVAPAAVPLGDGSVSAGRATEARGEDCRRRALGSRGDLDGAGRRDFAPRCVVRSSAPR